MRFFGLATVSVYRPSPITKNSLYDFFKVAIYPPYSTGAINKYVEMGFFELDTIHTYGIPSIHSRFSPMEI